MLISNEKKIQRCKSVGIIYRLITTCIVYVYKMCIINRNNIKI